MAAAAMALAECGGGFAASAGRVAETLPLPIAGLMSEKAASEVVNDYARIEKRTKGLGSKIDDPFLTLSFLALSVVPELKITDRGIVDSREGKFVSLFL